MDKGKKNGRFIAITKGIIGAGDFLASYVFLSLMVALMAIDPILRYIFGSPFYWSNEVTTYLMVLMIFNGFGVALANDKHIRVMLVFDHLSSKLQNVLWVVICFIGLFYVAFLGYSIFRLTLTSYSFRVRTSTAEMLVYPWQVMALVGMMVFVAAMILHTARKIAILAGKGGEENKIGKSVA